MKNITLSADDGLIEAARQRAASERTTLNEQFRRWLADYVGRQRQAAEGVHVMRELQGRLNVGRRNARTARQTERRATVDQRSEDLQDRQRIEGLTVVNPFGPHIDM